MKHSLHTVLTLLFVCASAWGENVPWQNPQINEINREPAHAHFIPYTNEANALKQQALPAAQRFAVNPATERRISEPGSSYSLKTMRNARQIFIKWGITPNAGKTYRFREAGNCKDLTPPSILT